MINVRIFTCIINFTFK